MIPLPLNPTLCSSALLWEEVVFLSFLHRILRDYGEALGTVEKNLRKTQWAGTC